MGKVKRITCEILRVKGLKMFKAEKEQQLVLLNKCLQDAISRSTKKVLQAFPNLQY